MRTVEDYKENIIKCLNYIVDRNKDIGIENCSIDDVEVIEMDYYQYPRKSYIIFLNNKYFKICPFTLISDALYILKNISNIEYVYNYNKGVDTLFGNIRQVLSEHSIPDYRYVEYLEKQTSLLNKEDVYNFIREDNNNET